MTGPPPADVEVCGAGSGFAPALRRGASAVALMALAGLAFPAPLRELLGASAIGTLVLLPLVRVAWLAVAWSRTDDRRFAWAASLLVATVVGGALGALVARLA